MRRLVAVKIGLGMALALLVRAGSLEAQTAGDDRGPLNRPWSVEFGVASIHDEDSAAYLGVGATALVGDYFRIGAHIGQSGADVGFMSGGLSVGLQLPVSREFQPFVDVRGGAILESDWQGGYQAIVMGVRFQISDRVGIRLSRQFAEHHGREGPSLTTLALEFR